MINIAFIVVFAVIVLIVLILLDRRKTAASSGKPVGKRRVTASLQEFLPLQSFHESGALVVNGKFRKQVHVGDVNLYSMSGEEIQSVRDRFKDMLKHLDHPFQISVQARRANYTDFVKNSAVVINESIKEYQNPTFADYSQRLLSYIREEAQKPRTDRENLLICGVLPKMGGEDERSQLERLEREQGYIESGLSSMGVPYQVLDPIESIEAIQNFWNRERAVSQRYRDAFSRQTHSPRVDGANVEVSDIVQAQGNPQYQESVRG